LVTHYNVYYSNDVVGVGAKVNLIKAAGNPFDLSVEYATTAKNGLNYLVVVRRITPNYMFKAGANEHYFDI
jgi:hypothetical protein